MLLLIARCYLRSAGSIPELPTMQREPVFRGIVINHVVPVLIILAIYVALHLMIAAALS